MMKNMAKDTDRELVTHSTKAQQAFNKRKSIVRNIPCLIWHIDEQNLFTHVAR